MFKVQVLISDNIIRVIEEPKIGKKSEEKQTKKNQKAKWVKGMYLVRKHSFAKREFFFSQVTFVYNLHISLK